MINCPKCGSQNLRYSRLRSGYERWSSLVGVRPLRCRDCRTRFVDKTWEFGGLRWAHCPACWRTDLAEWDPEDYHVEFWMRLRIGLGGRCWRCEYCRCNFVSFRPRKTKYIPRARGPHQLKNGSK